MPPACFYNPRSVCVRARVVRSVSGYQRQRKEKSGKSGNFFASCRYVAANTRAPPSRVRGPRQQPPPRAAVMALDVSRYLAWESIIYPDGGTCVPSPLCGAAPERQAARFASSVSSRVTFSPFSRLSRAAPPTASKATARLVCAKAWGTCATPMGTGEPLVCVGCAVARAEGALARPAPLAPSHLGGHHSRNPKSAARYSLMRGPLWRRVASGEARCQRVAPTRMPRAALVAHRRTRALAQHKP